MAKDEIKIPGWISVVSGAILTAITIGLSLAAYAFTTFETKEQALSREQAIEKRLDRIEQKIDMILER